jgi:hypothetical protein
MSDESHGLGNDRDECIAAERSDRALIQRTTEVVPNSRLKWLLREACDSERMGQVEMNLDELRAVLAELEVRRGIA